MPSVTEEMGAASRYGGGMDYLGLLRADAARLTEAAITAGLDAKVPSCPEWTVRDLVVHTGEVYRDKVACMRLRRRPEEGDVEREPAAGEDPVAWFRAGLDELLAELEARDPGDPSYSWYPPDQTVGFWPRRMAQETAVHRVDAELAAGDVTPIDRELAIDGVDEILAVFLGGPWYEEWPQEGASGQIFAVRTGSRIWRVTLEERAVPVTTDDGDAVATVSGEPQDVLLWLWGRPAEVTVDGDVSELRKRLAFCTD